MATMEERLAALEAITLRYATNNMLMSFTGNSTAPSTEKRLELVENTIKSMLNHDTRLLDLELKSNEQVLKLADRFLQVEIRVAEHDAVFAGLRKLAEKALMDEGPFRKG